MMAHSRVTTTVSRTVFQSRVAVSGRQIRWAMVVKPDPAGLDEEEGQRRQQQQGHRHARGQRAPTAVPYAVGRSTRPEPEPGAGAGRSSR